MNMRIIAVFVLIGGCATATVSERASLLAEPVDCATAQEDIAALEAAMPSRAERLASAVGTLTPIGAVAGAVTGSYGERADLLMGRTQAELDERIQEIRSTCRISEQAISETR